MIVLKNMEEIGKLRTANLMVAEILDQLSEMVCSGVSTYDLDAKAEEIVLKKGAKPAFKGYRGYPASLCTSINEEVVHGIPSKKRVLSDGDIISIDCGVVYEGFVGDAARTFPVGQIDEEAARLLRTTALSLEKGIEQARNGKRLSDIGHAIQSFVEAAGYSVVREFVGHGVGREMHEEPQVPNYGKPGRGMTLCPGLVLAIEPMVNMGGYDVEVLEDGWTTVTRDGSLSAHFEHSVAILENDTLVLSKN